MPKYTEIYYGPVNQNSLEIYFLTKITTTLATSISSTPISGRTLLPESGNLRNSKEIIYGFRQNILKTILFTYL